MWIKNQLGPHHFGWADPNPYGMQGVRGSSPLSSTCDTNERVVLMVT
jgi:hypothetical protein